MVISSGLFMFELGDFLPISLWYKLEMWSFKDVAFTRQGGSNSQDVSACALGLV